MSSSNPPKSEASLEVERIEAITCSEENVGKKRNIIMDMLQGIMLTPRKETSAEAWKMYIDAALDRLDEEVYLAAINKLLVEAKIEELKEVWADDGLYGAVAMYGDTKSLKTVDDRIKQLSTKEETDE